jgi:hypothetical protein
MLFFAIKQVRDGAQIPRWQFGDAAGAVFGDLIIADAHDDYLRRATRLARIISPTDPLQDLLTPLRDASIVYVRHRTLVCSGLEVVDDRAHFQSWMLASDSDSLHPSEVRGRR